MATDSPWKTNYLNLNRTLMCQGYFSKLVRGGISMKMKRLIRMTGMVFFVCYMALPALSYSEVIFQDNIGLYFEYDRAHQFIGIQPEP